MGSVDRAWFLRCAAEYEVKQGASAFPIDWESMYPCDDRNVGATFDAHYLHADLWAARNVIANRPIRGGLPMPHYDVGSRIDGLCAHLLAADIEVTHVDIRQPNVYLLGLRFWQADARYFAEFSPSLTQSISCIHAAEHIGLGRYGDEIDPNGMAKCMASLARILAPGGSLYFAVPIGRQRLVFNAHRVSSPRWVREGFESVGLTLESFAAVDDAGRWHPEARPEDYEDAAYGCGCFMFRK